jgi:probable DNA metabolism protein
MQVLAYDGSFEGWLSAVFDVYEYRFEQVSITTEAQKQESLFHSSHAVFTDKVKAERVWKGLQKYLPREGLKQLRDSFLSELPGLENMMLAYAQYAFQAQSDISRDYSHPAVRFVIDTSKKVYRERHRMEAFVRFQKTADELFFAIVEPDFNVLPLLVRHFTERYADQQWLIYDKRRKYGLYYNLQQTDFVEIDFNNKEELSSILNEDEIAYQDLWKIYFSSTNIEARKNLKLHIRHMPRRYWKYLTEKKLL